MYNQTAVFKGGYSITSDISHPIINTSHFLTIPRGNQLYINETRDDS